MSLENRYTTMFGTKTSRGQLYGGFFLLIAGIVLGLAALVLFFIARGEGKFVAAGQYNDDYFTWMRVAITLLGTGATAIFLGATVALPTKTGMRVLSYVGAALCALSIVLVAVHYPDNWAVSGSGQASYEGLDSGIFAVGIVLLLASFFTSLVGFYVDRMRPAAAAEEEDDDYGAGYEVPDWVVERDIEYAMKKYGVSWGEGPVTDTGLAVNIPDSLGSNVKIGGLGKAKVVQLDADQVDSGVKQLSGVRPNKKGALPSEWTDEATAALVAFRKQKAANPTLYKPRRSWWQRFWAFVTGRRERPQPAGTAGASLGSVSGGAPSKAGLGGNGAAPAPRRGTTVVIEDDAPAALPKRKKA